MESVDRARVKTAIPRSGLITVGMRGVEHMDLEMRMMK